MLLKTPKYHYFLIQRNISIFGYELFNKKDQKTENKGPNLQKKEDWFSRRKEYENSQKTYLNMPVKKILAFSSAKGGVGKSTCSVNVAVALSEIGLRVGILDGDLHSPSIPILMNLKDPIREIEYDNERHVEVMLPPMNYNIKCMSVGFIKTEGKAMIWKGPIIHYILTQMIEYIKWGSPDLDVLIVDFPPGTGDSQISLCQLLKFDGAVIITTPQDVALEDVRRGIDFFNHVSIPVLGVIENMSHYQCSNCGHKDYIFGQDGYKKLDVKEKPITLIGQVPLHIDIRINSDSGKPIVISNSNSPITEKYMEIARNIETIIGNLEDKNTTNFVVEE